jgi:hypothetical protein
MYDMGGGEYMYYMGGGGQEPIPKALLLNTETE